MSLLKMSLLAILYLVSTVPMASLSFPSGGLAPIHSIGVCMEMASVLVTNWNLHGRGVSWMSKILVLK